MRLLHPGNSLLVTFEDIICFIILHGYILGNFVKWIFLTGQLGGKCTVKYYLPNQNELLLKRELSSIILLSKRVRNLYKLFLKKDYRN